MATAQDNLQMASTAFRTAWTAAPANYDILAQDPIKAQLGGLANPGEGRPCRWVTCGVAGTLVVTGLDGVVVTLNAIAGQRFDIQAILLGVTSTAQNVSVFW